MANHAKLKIIPLTLLITGGIDIIRNLPTSAIFGSTLIFFFLFAGFFFLIPTALVSAELSSNVNEGGIFHWVKAAFGERTAFLAIWLQWLNNLLWFPIILSFIVGTAAYLINPVLAQNKFYLVLSILSVFWALTLVNLRGLRLSTRFSSFCAFVGVLLPILLIMGLGVIWVVQGNPLQIHLTPHNLLPNFHSSSNWMALTAIILSFGGMELTGVHINDVHEPHRTFPRALIYATIIILTTMTLGSLAIAFVLPSSEISMVNGTIQTFVYFFSAYHLTWLIPIVTVMLVLGSLGNVVSWVISPIKGISHAGNFGFLPPFFTLLNHRGMPARLLLLQALIVTVVCTAFLMLPSISDSYWLLTNLSTQFYLCMYVIMFLSAIKLRFTREFESHVFTIPGGRVGSFTVCLLGLIGCGITMIVCVIPPAGLGELSATGTYLTLFFSGMVAMLIPVLPLYWYHAAKKAAHTKPSTRLGKLEESQEAA